MGLLDIFRRRSEANVRDRQPRAEGQAFSGFDDPAFLEYIRSGGVSEDPFCNMAVLRCLSLICQSIGMLPLNLIEEGPDKRHATEHPVYRLLKYKPNGYQTPYEFKSQMQLRLEQDGEAFARVVWSRGVPIALIPLPHEKVNQRLDATYQMRYRIDGMDRELPQREVLHLRDLSLDADTVLSRTKLAKQAIRLALDAEKAASRVFRTGNMSGGAVEVPNVLSDTAYDRLRNSLDSDYAGAANAGRWMLLEEGAKANKFGLAGRDAQHLESRNHQIEEIARAYGVPRPLLMMDDTSWGSGVEQLGIFFIQYGLQPRFTAWEQAIERTLLTDAELGRLRAKYNERALMRGTLKEQADFFAKALGAGGHRAWMTQNEVRDLGDLPASGDPEAGQLATPLNTRSGNEPNEPPASA